MNWIKYVEDEVNKIPDKAGVYEIGDFYKGPIYIGGTDNLRMELLRKLPPIGPNQCINDEGFYFRYSLIEKYQEEYLVKRREFEKENGDKPFCNEKFHGPL